jgi:hypothetical protein
MLSVEMVVIIWIRETNSLLLFDEVENNETEKSGYNHIVV